MSVLELDHLYVVHAGTHRFALDERITAISAIELLAGKKSLHPNARSQ